MRKHNATEEQSTNLQSIKEAKIAVVSKAKHSPSSHMIPIERIAERAYQLWQIRGCQHGNDHQDWLDAENQLHQEHSCNN
jgi:hypothetical protein